MVMMALAVGTERATERVQAAETELVVAMARVAAMAAVVVAAA